MHTKTVMDDIIDDLEASNIPREYIVMAKFINLLGREQVVSGADLELFLANPPAYTSVNACLILDVKRMRETIVFAATLFFRELNAALLLV